MISPAMASEIAVIDELISMAQSLVETQKKNMEENQTDFDDFVQLNHRVTQLRKLMQSKLKSELEALQNEYESSYGQTDKAGKLDQLLSQEEQLKHEYCSVQEDQKELSTQFKNLEKQADQMRQKCETLKEEKDTRENETTVVIPLKREALMLYTMISGIRWNFEGSGDEIEGFITNESSVKTFTFDKNTSSQFTITNSLWDLMSDD